MARIEFYCEKCSQIFGVRLHERATVEDALAEIRLEHAQHSPSCGRQFGAAYCRRHTKRSDAGHTGHRAQIAMGQDAAGQSTLFVRSRSNL